MVAYPWLASAVTRSPLLIAAAGFASLSGSFKPIESDEPREKINFKAEIKGGFAWLWVHPLLRPMASCLDSHRLSNSLCCALEHNYRFTASKHNSNPFTREGELCLPFLCVGIDSNWNTPWWWTGHGISSLPFPRERLTGALFCLDRIRFRFTGTCRPPSDHGENRCF